MKKHKLLIVFLATLVLFGYLYDCYGDIAGGFYDMILPGNDYRTFMVSKSNIYLCRSSENFWGYDFRTVVLDPLALQCKLACDNEEQCLAWTFKFYSYEHAGESFNSGCSTVKAIGECFLKNKVPTMVESSMCVSGLKQSASETQVTSGEVK